MRSGRPTDDPKETLVAVRLSDRQLVPLQRRARAEGTSLSEALRRTVDHPKADRGREGDVQATVNSIHIQTGAPSSAPEAEMTT